MVTSLNIHVPVHTYAKLKRRVTFWQIIISCKFNICVSKCVSMSLFYKYAIPLKGAFYDFYMWSLIHHFVEYSLCYKLVKSRSQYYFSIQSYGILIIVKTSNHKAHNTEKMAVSVKENEQYFNII